MRSAPKTPVVCCHLPDQRDCLGREPRLSRAGFRFVLPEHTEELTMPAQQRLRLDKEKRLFPGSNHPGEEHQQKPVRLPVHWSFDLSMKDDQLMSQQRVFRQQFGFASGQISERSEHKGGRQWFDPTRKTRSWSACKRKQTRSLIEEKTHSTNGTSSL